MKCDRCGGFRQWLRFANRKESNGWWEYDGWLCMNCGEIIDPLILSNRHKQRQMHESGGPRSFGGTIIWIRPLDTCEPRTADGAPRPAARPGRASSNLERFRTSRSD